eukprot:CAMPEP_0202468256 /NCGR_PEP_ID=MMETSP1360-20130828/74710_1 /ASSEMBLY_ACC=CAM_ASM_000848 /TAXON_ID=515479 /ORGANISM="Licmophora paradoxa, Strain CCMP2313" /LENGTH=457 /DNA_ID=CAMNT_0049093121 /DNA_START=26 /DNA_END=1399 /DNA_ORIENTATION=-
MRNCCLVLVFFESLLFKTSALLGPGSAISSSSRISSFPSSFPLNAIDVEEKGGSSGLVFQNEDDRSKLASAFGALSKADQYDAVLTGLCAKILDETPDDQALESLDNPIQLIQEMNKGRVKASGRSLMALIDATIKAEDASAMTKIMSLCLKNGGANQFGKRQNELTILPPMPTSKVLCLDGKTRTRRERLDSLVDVPYDDRASEITAATATATVFVLNLVANFLGMDDLTGITNTLVFLAVLVGVLDNFYDFISFLAGQIKNISIKMPDKDSLPLGLGTGQLTGTVARGLSRLLTVDTERECECEAAAFFAAYSMGLPCFAFRPNALEGAVLVVDSMKDTTEMDQLLSNVGILKMLVWLMAPVAMESSKHPQSIVSDPREAAGFLSRLEDRVELLGGPDQLFWLESEEEKEDLLKWAYTEADLLLRNNREIVTELVQTLASGAGTVGDCVAVIEDW